MVLLRDMPSDVLLQHDVNEIQTFIHFAATMNKMYLKFMVDCLGNDIRISVKTKIKAGHESLAGVLDVNQVNVTENDNANQSHSVSLNATQAVDENNSELNQGHINESANCILYRRSFRTISQTYRSSRAL